MTGKRPQPEIVQDDTPSPKRHYSDDYISELEFDEESLAEEMEIAPAEEISLNQSILLNYPDSYEITREAKIEPELLFDSNTVSAPADFNNVGNLRSEGDLRVKEEYIGFGAGIFLSTKQMTIKRSLL